MEYVSRAKWGARAWSGPVHEVAMSSRTETLIHYHGGVPPIDRGAQVARDVDAIHHANGWAGVGYNWLIDQAGVIFEGRGWGLVGAHCPGHNRTGIGIYVAVGGTLVPSTAALRSARVVRDEACRLAGHDLAMSWHGEHYATDCPGDALRTWVQKGMRVAPPPVVVRGSLRAQTPPITGAAVSAVQRIVGCGVDGVYGPLTAKAVARWQRAHGLAADGIVGPATARALGMVWAGGPVRA